MASPELRVKLIMNQWIKTFNTNTNASIEIEKKIESLKKNKNSFYQTYKLPYFINATNEAFKKICGAKTTPEDRIFIYALSLTLALDTADLPTTSPAFDITKLCSDIAYFKNFVQRVTGNELAIDHDTEQSILARMEANARIIKNIDDTPINPEYTEIITRLVHQRLDSIYYPHLDKPLSFYYKQFNHYINDNTPEKEYTKLISIQLNSNRPAQLSLYFDNLENTCDDLSLIEVVVNIDDNDINMETMLLREINNRKFTIKYIKTERPTSFCDLWKPINKLLLISDPKAYFLLNISDEMFFLTKGWDTQLKKYVNYFEDGIFRLRASRNKFRNYFDRWECSFAQDSIPITTHKWVKLGGDWNPCFGPDSFQQLVAFYLAAEGAFSNKQYVRDIPVIDIEFFGDVPSIGIPSEKQWRHHHDHIRAMQICQSYGMQREAKRRAMLLLANIIAHNLQLENFNIATDETKSTLTLVDANKDLTIATLSYKINKTAIRTTNFLRKFRFFSYFGDGFNHQRSLIFGTLQYIKAVCRPVNLFYQTTKKLSPHFLAGLIKKHRIRLVGKIFGHLSKQRVSPLKRELLQLKSLYTEAMVENEKLKALQQAAKNHTNKEPA
ncbi:MAG TPA: hypothetical protein VFU82_03545 [Gammaproteobacteria bacterium]|nr:hypothetical protein [Gammaproteobacteria bacterium]